MTKVQTQFFRVQNYLKRIEALYGGINVSFKPTNTYEDDVYSYFMHCYHLCDWIKHDNTFSVQLNPFKYVEDSKYLSIARDICTGAKHCIPEEKKLQSGKEPKNSYTKLSICVGGDYEYKIEQMLFDTGFGQMDALALARKCFDEWIVYLEKEGIDYSLPR